MRLATFSHASRRRAGLVVRHPRDRVDWIFAPREVCAAAAKLPALKGCGYTWWRADFGAPGGGEWSETLAAWLALGDPALAALRRMEDFLRAFLAQGDPLMLVDAGWPLEAVALHAPLPAPRLLLGVVGNNAGFLRMDPVRGRNLHQPSCHQRTVTSIVGPGQPMVLPPGGGAFAGTTELGVVIGRGGRDIPRERARGHIAGYTVVNDGLGSLYARRWAALDREAGASGPHFHSANTASWLDKKGDTMLAMGPWVATPDEVGDPYDLLCWYRENGVTRNRAHTGAMACGIEETIAWLSGFLTLEPGMVLHLGALGQDGIPAIGSGVDTTVECEIERIGALRNPLRASAPTPILIPDVETPRHFWALLANTRAATARTGIAPRNYPLAYNNPPTALAPRGAAIRLPTHAGKLAATCELGVVIDRPARDLAPDAVAAYLRGAVVLLALRDSQFADRLVQPHALPGNMPEIYARWPDGFTVASEVAPLASGLPASAMHIECGVAHATASTSDYLLDFATVVAELSRGVTLLPGDVIALGETAATVPVPTAPGIRLRAEIEGLGDATAMLSAS